MGRAPCCEKIGLKKGPWAPEEDQKLTSYIRENGRESWRVLPKKAGLLRCGKSCRLRWTNYLRPDIKRGEFSPDEEQTIIQLHALLGNKWSAIATQLPKRTDNEIKNYWNTHLRKKLLKMGFDPTTHKPKTGSTSCNSSLLESPSHSNSSSSVIHMVQWETVRLEAEARLARESKMRAKGLWPSSAPWNSQEASCHVPSSKLDDGDLMSSEQDYGCLMASLKQNHAGLLASSEQENSSCTTLNSVELMTRLQNWETSLQGQGGLMPPDTWRLSNLISSVEGRESSSCTSPLYKLNHGSPTSTLCSLDQSSKQQLGIQYSTSSQARKISWTNNLLPNPHNPPNSSNDFLKPLPSKKPSQLGDDLQAVSYKISGGEISLLSLPGLQDLIQFDGFSMKRDDDSIVSSTFVLDSATDSSRLFGEIDLVSEDICSARSSSAASGSDNGQISYSALLNEEYADCFWNNVLKEVVYSPMQEQIESNESNTIQNNSTINTFSCSI